MAGIKDRFIKMWNTPDDEYEEYYDDNEPQDDSPYSEPARHDFSTFAPRSRGSSDNRVVNLGQKAPVQQQVVVFKPSSFGPEAREIADELLQRHTVVLNLEAADKDSSRRIVDFLSGVAYANNGKIKRIATGTFIITPYNVDLSGEDPDDGDGGYY